VLVLGFGVAEELFGEDFADPTGTIVRYQDVVFEVVGVMEETSDVAGENDYIYMPITTSQQRLAPPERSRTRDGGYLVDAIYMQAINEESIPVARNEVFDYLSFAHDIQFAGEEDFTVVAQSDVLESLNDITGRLTIFLSLIASTSLLVGGIGIMNIMLVTVTERTKEIGLRKALGARRIDILLQFLVESIILSLLGGALGITLGWLIAVAGTTFVSQLTLGVQMDAVLLATGVSIAVGLFFGMFPAYQASVKNPIDALRFE
jgi:putative ABC transport system permease protein